MVDLRSAEGWEEYLTKFAERRAKLSEEEEQRVVSTTLFLNRHPLTGEPFKTDSSIGILGQFNDDGPSKNTYMNIVRAASIAGDAFASIYASEAWMSVVEDVDSEEEALKRIGGAPSKDPQRRDILLLMCEHRTFERYTMTSVIESVDQQRRCLPWRKTPIFEGRFAGIVSRNPIHESMDTKLIRAYLQAQINMGRISDIIPLSPDHALN